MSEERIPTRDQLSGISKSIGENSAEGSLVRLQILVDGLRSLREAHPVLRYRYSIRMIANWFMPGTFPYCEELLGCVVDGCEDCPLKFRDECLINLIYKGLGDPEVRVWTVIDYARRTQRRIKGTPVETAIRNGLRVKEKRAEQRRQQRAARMRRSNSGLPDMFDDAPQFGDVRFSNRNSPHAVYRDLISSAPARQLSGLRTTYNLLRVLYEEDTRIAGEATSAPSSFQAYLPMCQIHRAEYSAFPCDNCRIGIADVNPAGEVAVSCPHELNELYSMPSNPAQAATRIRSLLEQIRPLAEAEE